MKTLVVEDKAYIRKGLLNLLQLVDADIQVIGECESVKEAVVVANACKPELVLLDINLTDGSAFDFLDQTPHLDFRIIFITAYEEFALKALKIGAVDYLLKPSRSESFSKPFLRYRYLLHWEIKSVNWKNQRIKPLYILLHYHDLEYKRREN